MTQPDTYTVADVATLAQCSEANIRRHASEGTMPAGQRVPAPVHGGVHLVFDRAEIDQWLVTRRQVGRPRQEPT